MLLKTLVTWKLYRTDVNRHFCIANGLYIEFARLSRCRILDQLEAGCPADDHAVGLAVCHHQGQRLGAFEEIVLQSEKGQVPLRLPDFEQDGLV